MQIIKYEINKNILTVGFKENNFAVFAQIFMMVQKLSNNYYKKHTFN